MNKIIFKFIVTGTFVLAVSVAFFVAMPSPAQATTSCSAPDEQSVSNPNGANITLPQTGTVTITYSCALAAWNDQVGLESPSRQEFGYSKSMYGGQQISLGSLASGTTLEFYLTNPSGQTWYSGPASNNSDGMVHANLIPDGNNQWTVGFEDQPSNATDHDYNDTIFTVTLTPTAPACNQDASKQCVGNSVYWYDSCGVQGSVYQVCNSNQTCSNGSCVNQTIACSSNSDCGTNAVTGSPFCQGNNVYQNYKTYTCNNPGTASSTCSSAITSQEQTTCGANQTCNSGSCGNTCTPNTTKQCVGNSVYNFDSCGVQGSVYQVCNSNQTCSNGSCVNQTIACSSNSDCGSSAYTGSAFCQGNNVYQNYQTYTCNNPGTSNSYCSNNSTSQLETTCNGNQTCNGGSCTGTTNNCTQDAYQQCSGNELYWYSSCGQQETSEYCQNGCSGNTCNNNVINNNCSYHAYQQCSNNALYWYSSCGVQQDLYQVCANGCSGNTCNQTYNNNNGNLNLQEQVRDLTTGGGWANSVNANPGDMLMFLITLQPTGNVNNQSITLQNSLPANLTYQNDQIVSGTTNYSGDIVNSSLYLNNTGNQTVTVSYQAQVGPAQNFAYGTTTLTNTVTENSNGSGSQSASTSVIVNRTQVLGASSVSTGLTNYFWTDSFFLPLAITLFALWLWKSGAFFGIEKWIDDRKKTRNGYKSEKELNARIAKLRESKI